MPRRRQLKSLPRRGRCRTCNAYPLFAEHRCLALWLVHGLTSRPRKVRAGSAGEACVILADSLEQHGKLRAQAEITAFARRHGSSAWERVTLGVAGVTTYHVMHVQPIPAC